MKIEKLPSGSYRVRKMYKGQSYTIVFDYKPTQKEVLQAIAAELDKSQVKTQHLTFRQAAEKYVQAKENVLSPRTVKEYSEIPNRLSEQFCDLLISDITPIIIQREINELSKIRGPKTVRNYHGFISTVLGTFRPELNISTTLPQKCKNEPYVPSDDDIKRILERSAGTKYEIPILLGCYGMRRSEICALTLDDIDGDVITINKAMVLDKNKKWVIKTTKTTESARTIVVPLEITNKIMKQGYVYKGHPNSISDYLAAEQEKLGIPHFTLHKLRHYFASKLSAMGVPEEDIMKYGGWETDYVMKGVYRHAMEDKNRAGQRAVAQKLGNALFS